uniref:Gag-pol n=1 Tax=Castanea mollissima TaxID=60419 RepID=K0GM10_9ROSI|nr:gag-pol precursor [Castanea mollissima]
MGKALRQISKSPFVARINRAKLPRRFSQPIFTVYNGRTDPVEHVSHVNQKMVVYSNNEALMCRVCSSSLGPVAMRWFDALAESSLASFEELTRAFGARFITCSRILKPLDALLSMAIREGETFKTYSDRYWEMYNEIDRDVESVAVRTFKVGLPTEHGLRKSLTMKAAVNMRQLMDWIDKYKQVEEDQMQSKGKVKVYSEKKDLQGVGFPGSRPKRDFSSHPVFAETPLFNSLFKDPIHHILEKIWHEPYFRPPNKMSGNASTRNQNLHCHYHQDKGHTTEDCRTLRDHLNQLAKAGKINHFLARPDGQVGQQGMQMYWGNTPQLALGTINVILAQLRRAVGDPSRVMSVQNGFENKVMEENNQLVKRIRFLVTPVLGFSDKDKEGTYQPLDDALVVTICIGGYDVRRVLVDDDGSGVEMMYPNLFHV